MKKQTPFLIYREFLQYYTNLLEIEEVLWAFRAVLVRTTFFYSVIDIRFFSAKIEPDRSLIVLEI